MKTTDSFREAIRTHLDGLADMDALFQLVYTNPKKNIEDCTTYILNQVKGSGANGFTDDEIFGMAVHYYDESAIDIGKEISMKVVINRHVELTEEEKATAKQKAIDEVIAEQRKKMTSKPIVKPTVIVDEKTDGPLTLF